MKEIFEKYATSPASESANEPSGVLTLDAFSTFLIGPDSAVFKERDSGIWQDMTKPMSEYYISSSHNTYLVGHQLVGVSTIEGYIRALLHSCRSVERMFVFSFISFVLTFTQLISTMEMKNRSFSTERP